MKKSLKDWCIENNASFILDMWDYERNDISPENVSYGSEIKVNWKCPVCNYTCDIKRRRQSELSSFNYSFISIVISESAYVSDCLSSINYIMYSNDFEQLSLFNSPQYIEISISKPFSSILLTSVPFTISGYCFLFFSNSFLNSSLLISPVIVVSFP